jgi:hypothetical protein
LALLPSALAADTPRVGRFVTVVICAVLIAPAAQATGTPAAPLLRRAASLSGLTAHRNVRVVVESSGRYARDVARAFDRSYPPSLQRLDDKLYMGLGLEPPQRTIRSALLTSAQTSRAWYDPAARVLRVRRNSHARHSDLLRELVRALVDQDFGLKRLTRLRAQNRDAALAANAIVDGLASLASGSAAPAVHGSPLDRFLQLEQNAGAIFGRRVIAELRSVGGNFAVQTALRTFPRTTAEALHVDKLLEQQPALPISLLSPIHDLRLSGSETFGELDLLSLLRAYDMPNADVVASGWGGGRWALYTTEDGTPSVAIVLRWDSSDDATRWQSLAPQLVAAAFPNAQARDCPAVDHCWLSADRELATATNGDLTVLASGAEGELVAASLAGLSLPA